MKEKVKKEKNCIPSYYTGVEEKNKASTQKNLGTFF